MTIGAFSTILTGEEKEGKFTLMVQLPPKKGPRMTVAGQQKINKIQDFGRDEHDTEVNAFILKVANAIEDARGKMSDQEREEADQKAEAILKAASAAASAPRRSA